MISSLASQKLFTYEAILNTVLDKKKTAYKIAREGIGKTVPN
jgi:hypothetical protein